MKNLNYKAKSARKSQGFTLIELSIVIAVIGIIMAILFSRFGNGFIQGAKVKDLFATTSSGFSMLEAYENECSDKSLAISATGTFSATNKPTGKTSVIELLATGSSDACASGKIKPLSKVTLDSAISKYVLTGSSMTLDYLETANTSANTAGYFKGFKVSNATDNLVKAMLGDSFADATTEYWLRTGNGFAQILKGAGSYTIWYFYNNGITPTGVIG